MKIIYPTETGVAIITPTGEMSIEEVAAKDVPAGIPYRIVNTDEIPTDRTFRNAWEMSGSTIAHNLGKCKLIGHDMRRAARNKELAPLDIEATIPAKAASAEAAREAIRQRYAQMQTAIDAATTPQGIKAALGMGAL